MEFGPLLERLYSSVMTELSDKRRIHTLGVKDTAIALAKKYGADPLKAEIAALSHDLYRGLKGEDLNKTVRDLGLDEKYLDNPNLAHSKIAAIMLKDKYGVCDRDILDAVSYHTTGRKNMSKLEKIIFLADAIEPGRDYPGVEDIRKAAEKGLDEGCLCSMLGTIRHVQEQGAYLDKDTIEAAEFLKENK